MKRRNIAIMSVVAVISLLGVAITAALSSAKEELLAQPTFSYKKLLDEQDNGVVVLAYHRILKDTPINNATMKFSNNEELQTYNVPLASFKEQMTYLHRQKVKVISYNDMLRLNEKKAINGKYVVITFDDIDRSMVDNALPILKKYHLPFTAFVITGNTGKNLGGSQLATWKQILEVEQTTGATVGLHTHDLHYQVNGKPILQTSISKKKMVHDYRLSQKELQKHIGHRSNLFAFPYGAYNMILRDYMLNHGVKSVATLNAGVVVNGTSEGDIPRFIITKGNWHTVAKWLR